MNARKRCSACGKTKSLQDFHRNRCKRDGVHSYCKPCQRSRIRNYESRRGKNILNRAYRYGLTPDEVLVFLQVPVCQSCGAQFNGSNEQMFDHCHGRSHLRGVICIACNTACQGSAEESIARLRCCIQYLLRDQERFLEQV